MKKITSTHILFSLLFSVLFFITYAQSYEQVDTVEKGDKKSWTFLVYLAGANDLDAHIQQNLEQMMAVGSNNRINILVYLSTHFEGLDKETRKLLINKDAVIQYGPIESRDSGSVETLKDALKWASTFPSDHIAVVLWDHGSGPLNRESIPSFNRGVCFDHDTKHYLTDRDLLHAFSWACDHVRQGKKFDIIAFDACLMGSFEIAATLSSCAQYMVASENIIPLAGYHYTKVLNRFNTQTLTPLDFAKRMVTAYNEAYIGTNNYTLSAVDLSSLDQFIINFSNVSKLLIRQLQGENKVAVKAAIKKSMSKMSCPCFYNVYIDLLQFYKNLHKNSNDFQLPLASAIYFKKLLSDGIALFPTFIKANVTSYNLSSIGGLTIYFDSQSIHASYAKLFWSEMNGWWLDFLKAYLA